MKDKAFGDNKTRSSRQFSAEDSEYVRPFVVFALEISAFF